MRQPSPLRLKAVRDLSKTSRRDTTDSNDKGVGRLWSEDLIRWALSNLISYGSPAEEQHETGGKNGTVQKWCAGGNHWCET